MIRPRLSLTAICSKTASGVQLHRIERGILLAFFVSWFATGSAIGVQAATEITFSGPELLGRPTDTSVTINIVPDATIEYSYQYGTTSGLYTGQTSPATATGGQPHETTITGLQPNTHYYYRMRYHAPGDGMNDWVTRDEHSFWTQRDPGATFSFTITSDSHVNILLGSATTWQQTLARVASDHPDFEIDLGDTFAMDNVTNVSGAEQAYLFQRSTTYLGQVGHSAPIFLAPGNHEQQELWHLDDTGNPATSPPVLGTNAEKKYFLNPVPDTFYTGNSDASTTQLDGDHLREDYYAWEWGDALFVVIDPYWYTATKPFTGNTGGGESSDTGSGDRWDWTLGQQQFNWLKQTLQGSDATFKFVFAHHMVGGSDDYVRGGANPANLVEWGGYNEAGTTYEWASKRPEWGGEPIHQMMVANGVSAFFHGHDHQYAYEKRDGIVYQSLPAAGFAGNGFNIYTTVSGYTIQALASPGHLRLTVSPSQATVDYVGTSSGTVNYSYVISGQTSNVPPVANNQSVNTQQDIPVSISLSATDANGDSLTYTVVTAPTHGTLSGSGANRTYTPAAAYTGSDSFTFKANDGAADSNIATVSLTVTSPPASALGGVNGDGVVNSTDALIILSADVGINTSQFCPMNCGDVNGDGFVNSTDALVILSYDVGKTVPYPVGQQGCPASAAQPAGCTP
jgi:hypothetical protein